MKSKIIFPIILSAMLLTACREQEQPSAVQTEQTETATQTVTEASETTTTTTTAVTTSQTAEETTTTVSETLPPKIENVIEDVELSIHKIDISGILDDGDIFGVGGTFFADNIAAKVYYSNHTEKICFFDINDLTVKASVAVPDSWRLDLDYDDLYPCAKGGRDVLCIIPLSRFDRDKFEDEYAVILVYKDFTTKFIEGEPQEIFSFSAGGHNISDHPYDLFDADSGKAIVEGFHDTKTDLGFDSKSFYYEFQIDEERFVYRICGFESMPGFGYYDFNNGTATDFPESKDFAPIGYHNGKIYAEEVRWHEYCQGELYTFDFETLEKKHFMSSLAEFETDPDFIEEYMNYFMSPSGEYIVAVSRKYNYKNRADAKTTFYIISPDSGETLAKCELNSSGIYYTVTFINDNCFAAQNGDIELIIFDVKM